MLEKTEGCLVVEKDRKRRTTVEANVAWQITKSILTPPSSIKSPFRLLSPSIGYEVLRVDDFASEP